MKEMNDSSRRAFILGVAGVISAVPVRESVATFWRAQPAAGRSDLDHSHLIDPGATSWPVDRSVSGEAGWLQTQVPPGDALFRRVWNPDADETVALEPLHPEEGAISLQPRGAKRGDGIDMLYREKDGDLEYLFDLGAPTTVRRNLARQFDGPGGDRFTRTWHDFGVTITADLEFADVPPVAIEIPYSLYLQSQHGNEDRFRIRLPTVGDNGFDLATHRQLVTALHGAIDEAIDYSDRAIVNYQRVAAVAEFVQSIPHATDWESKQTLHYVRRPEEALVELTADCKDAAVLMYDLLSSFGYDPAFVVLVGDPIRTVKNRLGMAVEEPTGVKGQENHLSDEDSTEKRKKSATVDYPNHVAIALPMHELPNLHDVMDGTPATFEQDGTEYVYIESTNRHPPGVYMDRRPRLDPVIYRSADEAFQRVLPLV